MKIGALCWLHDQKTLVAGTENKLLFWRFNCDEIQDPIAKPDQTEDIDMLAADELDDFAVRSQQAY